MTNWLKTKELFGLENTKPKSGDSHQRTVTFTERNSQEKFSLWSVPEKKFYRDGDTITIDGEEKKVDKYIKLTDEQKKTYNRSLKFSRELIVDGETYQFDLPMSLEKDLEKTMKMVETAMEKNPLNFQYTLVRNQTGPEPMNVEYEVVLGKEITTDSDEAVPEPEIDLDLGLTLNKKEKAIVEQLKAQVSAEKLKELPEEKLVAQFTKNGVEADRAKEIVAEELR